MLLLPQVIIPQVSLSQTTNQIPSTILERNPPKNKTHVLEPKNIPREPVSSRVTYFLLQAYKRTGVATANSKNSGEVLEKMQMNGMEG